jgi:hypothetical protein
MSSAVTRFDAVNWFVVFNGIADRWLWGFDADGWRLEYNDPALGSLAAMPVNGDTAATIEDARWLADALAFDHDAPVGIAPAYDGVWPEAEPKDPAALPAVQPIDPFEPAMTRWYWESINQGYGAAADLRFHGSYVLRYHGEEGAPSTEFSTRFAGREESVGLYAMAARQPDPLTEYLCVYRVLEALDKANGKACSRSTLPLLADYDFGELLVVCGAMEDDSVNVFDVYRERAQEELSRLAGNGESDVPAYLYGIRNSLAHGTRDVLTPRHGERATAAGRALSIVKLMARIAIEEPVGAVDLANR